MKTYTVKVSREGTNWLSQTEELPAAHTFAGNLIQLDSATREVIALVEDLPENAEKSLKIKWDYSAVGPEFVRARELADARDELRAASDDVAQRTKIIVDGLIESGWSVRDVAGVVGLTPGRVSQLTS